MKEWSRLLPMRNAASNKILGLFGDRDQTLVERAIAERRSGRPVILQHASRPMVAAAADRPAQSGAPLLRGS
jgi:hypothetical protein